MPYVHLNTKSGLRSVNQEDLKKELERLNKAAIPEASKSRIMEFIDDIKVQGLSVNRQYFYAIRLRLIASMMSESFLYPSQRDIKGVLAKLMEGKIGTRTKGKTRNNHYSDWEIENYKSTLKKFYSWHKGEERPDCVRWIRSNNHPNRMIKPDSLITKTEYDNIIKSLNNPRDKALIATLYDSGCRIGELLTLRNRDVEFDQYGAILAVTGKTGYRKVRIVGGSISYLREWQNSHVDRNNPEAWFFCGLETKNRGMKLEHANVYRSLRRALEKGKIDRRIYPHLFRHTRATMLASRVTEAPLEAQMGWVHGSKMTRTYVHLSVRDQDNAILKAYGIEIAENKPLETDIPINCPRCGEPNERIARFCWKCGMILDKSITEEKLKHDAKLIEASILKSEAVDEMTKDIVKGFPEEFKDLIIESVLQKIVSNPELRQKFNDSMKNGHDL
jgi:integrase